ncbi:MAG TPA: hypothetical protein P5539_05495 [Mesotoga sp.]|nr:hypothetical protein [Mesotoga sp.]
MDEFVIVVIAFATTVILGCFTVILGCFTGVTITKLDNDAIVKMVGDGANPVAARCAVSGRDSVLCDNAAKANAQIQALTLQVEAMRQQTGKGL